MFGHLREALLENWRKVAVRNRRVFLFDFCLLAFSVYVGFALRLTLIIPPLFRGDCAQAALLFPLCVASALWLGGSYRTYWPQASVEEYARLAQQYALGCALFLILHFFLKSMTVPRSSLAIMFFAGIVFLGAMRASWRFLELSAASAHRRATTAQKTLIIGAGEAGAFIARDLQRRHAALVPLGFIDDDPEKQGKSIAGLPVLGNEAALTDIASKMGAQVALIAIPSAGGTSIRKYLDRLSDLGVEVRVLPSLRELAGGQIALESMRSVELQDLLRREPIKLDQDEIGAVLRGKKVLVTGAGGSIGSEICFQALQHHPSELLLLGHGEQSIYNLMRKLDDNKITTPYRPLVADIADRTGMERIFAAHRPDVVFHAAAHKHVPLMEENPREALRVNALGTWTISHLAGEYGAERFVMISTDKAVHPSSVMGATKRVAERLLRNVQQEFGDTSYMTVRFGNVLGSRGSVIPLFEEQIKRGGPVTVTHPDMNRYFMLIPEAVSLVLQAASMGRGGELYVLDMGKPVNIAEMAETLIRLHGREPYEDVQIVFTGIRPGEKLFEELFYDPDHVTKTLHDKIFLSKLHEEGRPLIDDAVGILDSNLPESEMRKKIFALGVG